jgi:hypothetical protein
LRGPCAAQILPTARQVSPAARPPPRRRRCERGAGGRAGFGRRCASSRRGWRAVAGLGPGMVSRHCGIPGGAGCGLHDELRWSVLHATGTSPRVGRTPGNLTALGRVRRPREADATPGGRMVRPEGGARRLSFTCRRHFLLLLTLARPPEMRGYPPENRMHIGMAAGTMGGCDRSPEPGEVIRVISIRAGGARQRTGGWEHAAGARSVVSQPLVRESFLAPTPAVRLRRIPADRPARHVPDPCPVSR